MLIVGCGPIGCELGQAFARLGTKVIMSEMGSQFLPRDDSECVGYLQEQMLKEGVQMHFDTKPVRFEKIDDKIKATVVTIKDSTETQTELVVDAVMLAIGRVPNVSGLGLEAAGIEFNLNLGIKINNQCLTTNANVYAVGDCVPGPKFTHNSDVHARSVVKNAFFFKDVDLSTIPIPYCTYTDPQVAAVGKQE